MVVYYDTTTQFIKKIINLSRLFFSLTMLRFICFAYSEFVRNC